MLRLYLGGVPLCGGQLPLVVCGYRIPRQHQRLHLPQQQQAIDVLKSAQSNMRMVLVMAGAVSDPMPAGWCAIVCYCKWEQEVVALPAAVHRAQT